MKVLVTGSGGQLGQEFMKRNSEGSRHEFVFLDRQTLDITNESRSASAVKAVNPDIIINTAAYTAVDKAESEIDRAQLVNVNGVGNMATVCAERGIPLLHFSSDYVYHNGLDRPLIEDDPCDPKGIYAKTKLEGERLALRINPASIVLRTSWVYAGHGHNFMNTMLKLGKERESLNIVYDQIGAPTACADLVDVSLKIMDHIENGGEIRGVFNYSNRGVTSWYDYAIEIFRLADIKCKVEPIISQEYPTPAPRPNFSVLNTNKIQSLLNISIPHWRSSLEKTYNEIMV